MNSEAPEVIDRSVPQRAPERGSERGLALGDASLARNAVRQEDVDFGLRPQFGYPILARGGDGGVDDAVLAAYAPQSPALEPLRALRSQLMLRWLPTASRRMLAVTSPAAREGRSWLAANIATVFAQTGQPTLLIDADMRSPSQHRLFNLDNSVGLSSLLTARAGGRDVFRRIHPQLELFVLPAGMVPPNPQELLLQPLFEKMLERFAQLFSMVVLDTPAAMSCSDAQVVAARAGSAVLLSRRNSTRVAGLMDTLRSLTDSGVHVLGSVVNEH